VVPFEFTSEILFKSWKLEIGEPEFTIMRIIISGKEKGIRKKIVYDLYDEYDALKNVSSMARTTGYTATATADMILNGLFHEKGLFPPELLGKNKNCLEYVLQYLRERNVIYHKTEYLI